MLRIGVGEAHIMQTELALEVAHRSGIQSFRRREFRHKIQEFFQGRLIGAHAQDGVHGLVGCRQQAPGDGCQQGQHAGSCCHATA